jgi:hypothetical protein
VGRTGERFANRRQVFENFLLDLRVDPWMAVLGAKDKVQQDVG